VRIQTYEQAKDVIDRDPAIDPWVFWDSIGVELEAAQEIGRWSQKQAQIGGATIDWSTVMTLMEIGATLAKEGLSE
jgi:hypothetical protein